MKDEELLSACRRKSLEVDALKQMIETGANVNAAGQNNETALHMAAWNNNQDIILNLLSHSVPLEIKTNSHGWTPLFMSVCNNSVQAAKMLITYGANVNAQDNDGYTPLHFAAINGDGGIANVLLNAGADTTIKSHRGDTALSIARALGNRGIVSRLLAHNSITYTAPHYLVSGQTESSSLEGQVNPVQSSYTQMANLIANSLGEFNNAGSTLIITNEANNNEKPSTLNKKQSHTNKSKKSHLKINKAAGSAKKQKAQNDHCHEEKQTQAALSAAREEKRTQLEKTILSLQQTLEQQKSLINALHRTDYSSEQMGILSQISLNLDTAIMQTSFIANQNNEQTNSTRTSSSSNHEYTAQGQNTYI